MTKTATPTNDRAGKILARTYLTPSLWARMRHFGIDHGLTVPETIATILDKNLPQYAGTIATILDKHLPQYAGRKPNTGGK